MYMVVTVRVDRVKGSAVDESSTVATVGPFGGGINLIRMNKMCEVHTHFFVRTLVAMKRAPLWGYWQRIKLQSI
jgi:hypothetical protein